MITLAIMSLILKRFSYLSPISVETSVITAPSPNSSPNRQSLSIRRRGFILCNQGANLGCQEALFTLGEKPELRYKAAREALATLGFETTLEYVGHVAEKVLKETGVLPHINAGNLTEQEIAFFEKSAAQWESCSSPHRKGCVRKACPTTAHQIKYQRCEFTPWS